MENQSPNQKIVKNSIAGIARVAIVTPIFFMITPFTLNKLGIELYGVWALGSTVISFAQLSDLGMGRAVVRYVAQYSKNSNSNAINELINTTLMTYLIIGLLVFTLIVPNANWITINIFRIPEHLNGDANIMILGSMLIFIINLLMGIFTNILDGFQRMDLSNFANILSVLLQSAGTFIALSLGWGLKGLIVGNIFAILITGVVAIIFVKNIYGSFILHMKFVRFRVFKIALGYSLQIQTANIISLVFDPFIRILITNLCGISFLSYYDISNKIISIVRSVFLSAINPLMPASAEISADGLNKNRLIRLHYHSERYILLVAPIIFFLSIVLMPRFISLWIGVGYSFIGITYQIIAIGWLFSLIATPAFVIFAGAGHPKFQIYSQLVLVISNVTLGLLLGNLIGYIGIVISVAASLILASLYLLGSFAWLTGGGLRIFAFKIGGLSVLIAGAVSFLISFTFNLLPLNYFSLIAVAAFGGIGYIVTIGRSNIFTPGDIVVLETLKIKGPVLKFVQEYQVKK